MKASFRAGVRVILTLAFTVTAGVVMAPGLIREPRSGDSFVRPSWFPAGPRYSPRAPSRPSDMSWGPTTWDGRSWSSCAGP